MSRPPKAAALDTLLPLGVGGIVGGVAGDILGADVFEKGFSWVAGAIRDSIADSRARVTMEFNHAAIASV